MSVEKGWDEVWVAVKFQTNSEMLVLSEISLGEPRNRELGGRALFGRGPVMGYRLQINSECQ